MKHLNFLTKSGSQSCGHSSVTLASTVGSPSAHRRGTMLKLLSVLVLVLTFGVGNVWADYELVYTFDCASASHNGTTSSYGGKTTAMTTTYIKDFLNAAAGSSVVSSVANSPSRVYWAKGTGGDAGMPDDALKVGASSNSGNFSFTVNESVNISKVVITGYGWKSTSKIAVNGSSTQSPSSAAVETDFSFELASETKTISINVTTSAVCITSIKLYKTVASCSSEITITKGSNPANGTFMINNSGTICIDNGNASTTVTATPSTHYHLAEVTSTGGGTIGTISNNTCTVSDISANTTINVSFAADPTYTVTWVAGSNSSFSTQTNYAGTDLTSPGTPEASTYCPGGKVFKGWTATPIEGEADEAPADLFTSVSGKSIPVNGTTYYAVFATENSETINVPASDKQYTATITYSQLTANASYANSDGDYSSTGTASDESATTVGWTTYNVQNASSKLHFKSNSGYIYNKSTWGTINSVSFSDNQSSNFNVYIGSSSQPSSAGSGGFFKIAAKTVSGGPYVATITITYTQGSPASSYEQTTYTDYATSCCTPLGSINGSVSEDQPTSATLTWDVKDNVTWTVSYKVKNAAGEASTANVGTITTSEGKNHCTITGLNPATTYEFYVHATATGYCENEETWTIEGTTAAAHTITAVSSNSTYGTVSLSGNVITGEPADYCQYASPAFTVTSGTADVTQEGNVFTVDPSSDCTVQINFEKIPVYTVNLNAGTGSVASSSLPEEYRTLGVTLPVATAPTGWSFVGWTTASVTETATRPATIYSASSTYIPSADGETLYAVYEQWDGNENEFQRVTALNGLAAGDRVVVVSNGTYKHTLATDNGSFKKNETAYTADANNKISVSDNKHIWTLGSTNTTNVYTLTNVATGTTLGASALCGSGNNEKQKDVNLTSTNNQWLLTKSGTDFVIKNNAGTSYLETASGGFCIYYQYSEPSGKPLSDYYQMLIFKGTAEKKYATAPKSVKALAVKTAPTTAYRVGDVFDATGTVLDATYSDDTHGDITEGYTYVVNNLSDGKLTAESNQVTYTYKGQTANLAITAGTLSSIVITTEPAKKKYAEGESFDATGMAVKAVFSNGLEIADVNGYTFSDAALTPSDESVTISYTYGEDTKTTTQAISVGSLSSIAVTTAPSTTSYTEGTAFSTAGMVVTGTYSNGETRVLNGYTIEPSGELSYPCTSVTISYQGKTTTQTITVSEAPKYTVHFWTNGTDNVRQVIQGRALTDIPTPAAVDGFTFMGWASAELAETTAEPASYALSNNASSYTPSQDGVEFYAVYRRSEESVKNGFKLSVTYSNTTYYVGTYGSYFEAENNLEDAEVYFFDEDKRIYGYDGTTKKYVQISASSTTSNYSATAFTFSTVTEADGKVSYSYTSGTDTRRFALNTNKKDRFSGYSTTGVESQFTKTAAQKVVTEYLYSTSAVVPVLQSIAVTTAPTKTEYFEGDDFEADGMVVTGTFNTGAKVLTASQYTISPSTNLTAGTTSVTIAAVEDNTKTASQTISVAAIELTSITITTQPTKKVYVVGQNFDPTGMVVTAHYNDDRKDKAVTGYTMTPSTSTALTAEDDHIEISYTEGGVTKTANQAITVNAALTGIEITTNPDKMTYIETETFDATGMVVTAHYNGSSDQIVTASVTWDKTGVLAALNSLANPTVETITFTYEELGAEVTTTLNVTVNPYPRYTVTFSANGTPTNVTETAGQGGVTVPANPAKVGDYTFAGWSKSQRAVESADDPALVTITAGKYYPEGAETLYAVYTMDHEDEVAGMYLTAVVDANNTEKTIGYFNNNSLYPTDENHSALALWYLDDYLFYMNGTTKIYLYNTGNSETKIFNVSENGKAADLEAAANNKWTKITNNDGTITFKRDDGRIIAWNNSSYFRCYGENTYPYNKFTATTASESITFEVPYYTTAPSADVTPTISFAETSKTITVVDENGALNTCTNALTTNSTGAVTYVSSDESIAEVAANGTVSVKAVGEVTITANVAAVAGTWKAISKSYTLTIEKATASASFGTPATTLVYKDNTIALPATSEQAITITYSSNDNTVATIDESGNVTGVATSYGNTNQRTVTIYANWAETDYYEASTNSTRGKITVTVKNNAKTQTLSFTDEAKDFGSDQGDKVYTNTLNGAKTSVTYASSDETVAEVDENTGEVTVHTNAVGSATITATAAAGNVIEDGIQYAYAQAQDMYVISIVYPRPTISVASCEFKAPFEVALSSEATNVEMIVYTTDGTDPSYADNNGDIYTEPIAINATTTLKAIAVSDEDEESPVATATYTKLVPELTEYSYEDNASLAANTEMTITASEGALVAYAICDANNVELTREVGTTNSLTFQIAEAGTYKIYAQAKWDVENGFKSATELRTVHIKGAVHLPISYEGKGTEITSEPYFTVEGNYVVDNYGDAYINAPIKIKNTGSLTAAFLDEPNNVVFYLGGNGVSGSTLKVQESADGENFEDVEEYTADDIPASVVNFETGYNGGGVKQNLNLKSTTRFVRWSYTKVSGNVALGKIAIYPKSMEPDNSYEVPVDFTGDVVVEDGVAWNITEAQTIHDLTVKQGAEVWNNEAITVNNLYIEAQEGKSGQITEDESITIVGNAYYDLTLNTSGTMDNSKWYAFAVPFQVDAATGIQRLSNDGKTSNAGFNSHYVLLKYNSAAYASAGQGWEYVTRGETLMPGKFYMIALNSNEYNRVRMTKKAGSPVNNKANLTLSTVGTGIHANWNALANNALAYANVSASGLNADLKVQVYNSAEDSYTAFDFNKVTFTVGTPFFIQVAEAGTMNVDIAATYNETVKAPAREAVATGEFQIRLGANTESYYDILYVSASDEALNEYQIGHDLAKSGVSTTVPQMYVPAYGAKLCDAEFPLVNNEATFPLTFTAPSAGTYQLYISKAATDAELFLTKDGSVIWNLSTGAYALTLEKGTTEGYGLLLVQKMPMTPTGVDEPTSDSSLKGRATKVVIDEHVYILRGGQMYGIDGKIVK